MTPVPCGPCRAVPIFCFFETLDWVAASMQAHSRKSHARTCTPLNSGSSRDRRVARVECFFFAVSAGVVGVAACVCVGVCSVVVSVRWPGPWGRGHGILDEPCKVPQDGDEGPDVKG